MVGLWRHPVMPAGKCRGWAWRGHRRCCCCRFVQVGSHAAAELPPPPRMRRSWRRQDAGTRNGRAGTAVIRTSIRNPSRRVSSLSSTSPYAWRPKARTRPSRPRCACRCHPYGSASSPKGASIRVRVEYGDPRVASTSGRNSAVKTVKPFRTERAHAALSLAAPDPLGVSRCWRSPNWATRRACLRTGPCGRWRARRRGAYDTRMPKPC